MVYDIRKVDKGIQLRPPMTSGAIGAAQLTVTLVSATGSAVTFRHGGTTVPILVLPVLRTATSGVQLFAAAMGSGCTTSNAQMAGGTSGSLYTVLCIF